MEGLGHRHKHTPFFAGTRETKEEGGGSATAGDRRGRRPESPAPWKADAPPTTEAGRRRNATMRAPANSAATPQPHCCTCRRHGSAYAAAARRWGERERGGGLRDGVGGLGAEPPHAEPPCARAQHTQRCRARDAPPRRHATPTTATAVISHHVSPRGDFDAAPPRAPDAASSDLGARAQICRRPA